MESLLVVKTSQNLTKDQIEKIHQAVNPVADRLGLEVMVAGNEMDIVIHQDVAPLLKELIAEARQQTAAINRLASLQEQLLIAMADADGEQDVVPTRYMDGSMVR